MSTLANRSFAKMNGIGNEIVVLDLRGDPVPVTAADARAIASQVPYDQLMVLQPPRAAGTEAFIRIYNNDGSELNACGNGMRCVAKQVFSGTDAIGAGCSKAAPGCCSAGAPRPISTPSTWARRNSAGRKFRSPRSFATRG